MRFVFLVVSLIWAGQLMAETCANDHVSLRGDWGLAAFTVEIADTPQQRAQGLMYREQMARRSGMLFIYESPRAASFWMKNTLIPLDMLFADKTGRITRVHSQAIPGDLTPIDGGSDVYAVLEINGGLAKSYGITPGSVIRHPAFTDGPAAWPC